MKNKLQFSTIGLLVFISGCSSVNLGINVSVFDVIRETKPKSEISFQADTGDVFNCIKRELTKARLSTDRLEISSGEIMWQVGDLSFLDRTSINAVYHAKNGNELDIYVTGNMFMITKQLQAVGENCANDKSWSAPKGYWPIGMAD